VVKSIIEISECGLVAESRIMEISDVIDLYWFITLLNLVRGLKSQKVTWCIEGWFDCV
jgi:hypothetical protein